MTMRLLGENKISVFNYDNESEFIEMRRVIVNSIPLIAL